ncbi:MAG TPA: hypothetical protein VFV78_09695 [Vicinamibacterales bacterium]|nr:hypothetical protein [Vicinamibacterales bacterium]
MSPLFNWAAKKGEPVAPERPASLITENLSTSRALPKFIAALAHQSAPVLLDLGPVVGANVSFFGDRLACKMLIEDLHETIGGVITERAPETLATRLTDRISRVTGPVDGVLCWDVFDYLDRGSARALASSLRDVLAAGGVLHGLFGTVAQPASTRTRFIMQSETAVKCRTEPWLAASRHAYQTGEITRMFEGLTVVESVLLQNRTRETLFRKR